MFIDDNLGIILFAAILAFIGFLVWLVKYFQKTSTSEEKKELGSAFEHLGLALVIGVLYWGTFFIFEHKIGSGSIFIFLAVIIGGGALLEIFFRKSEKKTTPKPVTNKIPTNVKNNNTGSGFWHGREGLAVTFWGYFVAGNIIGNLLMFFGISINVLIFYLAVLAVIVWNVLAVMGVFNAANIYTVEKVKKSQTYGYATAAKIASVVLILSAIGNSIPK